MTTQMQNQPTTPQPPALSTHPVAIAGFVLAFVLWPAGLVLSILALRKTGREGGGGRGLAIAGVTISSVGALGFVVLAVVLSIGATVSGGQADRAEMAALKADVANARTAVVVAMVESGGSVELVPDDALVAAASTGTLRLFAGEETADFCIDATNGTQIAATRDTGAVVEGADCTQLGFTDRIK